MDIHQYPFMPETFRFWTISFFVFGACIGSFLNVCIWRIPRGESLISPPSRCPKCGHPLSWYENIPMISWLFLMGRCRSCKAPITARYFIVELMTALLFSMLFIKAYTFAEPLTILPAYFLMASLAITTAFIDCELRIIPNETTYTGMIAGLLFAGLFPETWQVSTWTGSLALSAAAFAVSGGFMALAALAGKFIFKREALGWGDVKYIAAVGACLGVPAAFFAVFAGSLIGAVAGLLIALKKGRRRPIAFGPFLAAGAVAWMLFGMPVLKAYLSLVSGLARH